MRRRTVLASGAAGLAALILPTIGWRDGGEAGTALRHVAEARRTAMAPPLMPRPDLVRMARRQVLHMEAAGTTTHLGADGSDPVARARDAGYAGRILGEALAETHDGPAETVALWLAHAPTRDVLLDPGARDLGLVMHHGTDGRMWWNLVVGA
jgi:uncharacterized protein YkwD